MGNLFSTKNYCRLSSNRLEETPLVFSVDVSSVLRNAKIEYVSDETLGNASNLIKHEPPTSEFNSIPEESRDGWIVKRHANIASVTIRLCEATDILGYDIDTTGFKNICPTYARIQGLKTPTEEDIEGNIEEWVTLLSNEAINENSHNFFYKNNTDECLYSHVCLTISPSGGIARFRTYGDIVSDPLKPGTEYNLASANLGARIVRTSDTDNCSTPNVLLDNGTLATQGWLTPRSRSFQENRNDFVIIQLATCGCINSVIIDTTGFRGLSPLKVCVEACNSTKDDPNHDYNVRWYPLIYETSVKEDTLNIFQLSHDDFITHVRMTLIPDGGIQQIQCIGTIPNGIKLNYVDGLSSSLADKASEEKPKSNSQEVLKKDESSTCTVSEELNFDLPTVSSLGVCNNNLALTPPSSQESGNSSSPEIMEVETSVTGKRKASESNLDADTSRRTRLPRRAKSRKIELAQVEELDLTGQAVTRGRGRRRGHGRGSTKKN
ncbi:hypothetical protein MFLAVUS_007789 [Mucor flavus]|uniref:Allantoicase domain-containing protein n=1 Tax=Mucor flavus TaxID=439312 RepID=A0ABP9Z595_9FUNG